MFMIAAVGHAAITMDWEHEITPDTGKLQVIATLFPKDGLRLKVRRPVCARSPVAAHKERLTSVTCAVSLASSRRARRPRRSAPATRPPRSLSFPPPTSARPYYGPSSLHLFSPTRTRIIFRRCP